jgi:hypothetical protein
MPLGYGPLGGAGPAPATEAHTTAVSCREIDAVARDYTTDADGNPPGMDGTANRVYLLFSYADVRAKIITAQGIAAREAAIRAALAPLMAGRQPAIADLAVKVNDAGGDRVRGLVTYKNLLTSQVEKVEIQ